MSATAKKTRNVTKWTLPIAFKNFWKFASPWILAVGIVVCWSVRVALGSWNIWDLVIVAALLASWPLVEWLIHVFILHRKPTKIGDKTIDLHLAKKHRDHHLDPGHLPDVVIPTISLILTVPVAFVLWWLITPDLPRMFTGVAFLFTMGMVYEWCHFLIHTNYRPKTSLFKHLWRHHRLHHFKHEEYWFGVSMTGGDRLLGTAPNFKEIETSPTCRTLGVDEEKLE